MIQRRIRRRPADAGRQASLPASLHPVLRRVYGARGLAGDSDLDLSLERLLPVGTLGGHALRVVRGDRWRIWRRRRALAELLP